MPKLITTGLALAALAVAPVAAGAAERAPTAERKLCAAASDSLGFSYVTDLKAKRTSCRKAKKVARAYAEKKFGRLGVRGFNCRESNVDKSPFQRSAHVVCKDGRKKVVWDYTENI